MTKPLMWIWLITFFGVLVWSAVAPKDYPTWMLEVSPALVGFVLLALTRHRFPLTTLVYVLILIHAIILMVGGHYTYAEVPLFDRISELFGGTRNNYDKLGHIAQGLVPAMVAREILIRNAVVNGRTWMNFFIVRRGGGRVSGYPGICLGYPVGYVLGLAGRCYCAAGAGEAARCATASVFRVFADDSAFGVTRCKRMYFAFSFGSINVCWW
jgi:hypothetical protein